jgi:hypothetical protein
MKGILAYEAFNQISDTFVDESYIPGAEALLAPPARRTRAEREEGPLRRFMNSGWGVACVSMFVALTVLAGIIWAGQRDPVGIPSVGTSPADTSLIMTEALTTLRAEDTEADTTFESSTDPGPETVRPDEPVHEPDIEAVLSRAESMAPDIPEDAALVGETALTMWYSEDGSNIQKQVSRIAVYRDGTDPYTHYLYADVLANNGKLRQSETGTIHGCFALMESDTHLVLATVEGAAVDQSNSRVNILVERWYSWTDADAWSGEDLGDIRILREESELGEWTASFEVLEKQVVRSAERSLVTTLAALIRGDGGEENTGVLVDFLTVTDVPRVYARADSQGEEAAEARGGILDGTCFSTAWVALLEHLEGEAVGLDPAPPVPVETTNWEDYAGPMEPDAPEDVVVMGYTYTTDHVTKGGETFEAISRIALYGFRGDESYFYLYRDVLAENGEIIASDTRKVPTLFGLAQSSLDGSLQLYTVTAGRQNSGTAYLGLSVQILHWSDVSPTGESVGEVKAWMTPCEEASWLWEESTAIMVNKGMDYGWQIYAFDIGNCWLQNTKTYWEQTLGELGMDDSGYLTFLMDKLLNVKLEDMYVLHPEDDEETRMGTYFFLSTGSDHLNRWFQYHMSGLGYIP